MSSDSYKTLSKPAEPALYKEKNSKFYAYAFPVTCEAEIQPILVALKKQHHAARHLCYAFQLGKCYRVCDAGEPNYSAGMPIYGQIKSFGLSYVLVVVARYFGGIKLGAGGLMAAYKEAARSALQAADIIEKTADKTFILRFPYKDLNYVMRIIRERNICLLHSEMALDCVLTLAVRRSAYEQAVAAFAFYDTLQIIEEQ